MTNPSVADPITTDPLELHTLLLCTPAQDRDQIRDDLIAQLGDDTGWHLYHSVITQVDHAENITQARDELRDALAAAETSLAEATRVLTDLSSITIYDIEYVHGHAAMDMATFLADASRMVRAAIAVNPCPDETPSV